MPRKKTAQSSVSRALSGPPLGRGNAVFLVVDITRPREKTKLMHCCSVAELPPVAGVGDIVTCSDAKRLRVEGREFIYSTNPDSGELIVWVRLECAEVRGRPIADEPFVEI